MGHTPGVEAGDNATVILGETSEPQTDLMLRIATGKGSSQLTEEGQYVVGPPELVAEIAHSSRALDLHQKLDDYQAAGVSEHLVCSVEDEGIFGRSFSTSKSIQPNRDGILKSSVFPGLWLCEPAFIQQQTPSILETLQEGLRSKQHESFCKRLS